LADAEAGKVLDTTTLHELIRDRCADAAGGDRRYTVGRPFLATPEVDP
jgi:hypothetical protein